MWTVVYDLTNNVFWSI